VSPVASHTGTDSIVDAAPSTSLLETISPAAGPYHPPRPACPAAIMSDGDKKIRKEKNAQPDDFEKSVGQALDELEKSGSEIKAELRELFITSAKEVDCGGGKSAVVLFVPYRLLTKFHKVQTRLVRELEKKFSGKNVIIIAQRKILPRERKNGRLAPQKRPHTRTLTAVHDAILEDMVYPTEIVGRRTRYKVDGSRQMKVYLDPKDQNNAEYKTETFGHVYKNLTGKDVVFEFPVTAAE
jgi:small subunit ribosomal protein S7e